MIHRKVQELIQGAPCENLNNKYTVYQLPYATVLRIRELNGGIVLEGDAPTPRAAVFAVIGFLIMVVALMLVVALGATGRSALAWWMCSGIAFGAIILLVASRFREKRVLISYDSVGRKLNLLFAEVSWKHDDIKNLIVARCMAPRLPFPKQMTIRNYVGLAKNSKDEFLVLKAGGVRDWEKVKTLFVTAGLHVHVAENVLCIDDGKLW